MPRAPTLGLMLGVGLLDLVFGVGVLFGIEGGTFARFETPWSHSLVMALLWSALYATLFRDRGTMVVASMAAAVFSHWLLDLVSHRPDMQLWPHSSIELGYGPAFGGLGGWLELAVSLAGVAVYVRWARRPANRTRRWAIVAAVIAVLYGLEVAAVP